MFNYLQCSRVTISRLNNHHLKYYSHLILMVLSLRWTKSKLSQIASGKLVFIYVLYALALVM